MRVVDTPARGLFSHCHSFVATIVRAMYVQRQARPCAWICTHVWFMGVASILSLISTRSLFSTHTSAITSDKHRGLKTGVYGSPFTWSTQGGLPRTQAVVNAGEERRAWYPFFAHAFHFPDFLETITFLCTSAGTAPPVRPVRFWPDHFFSSELHYMGGGLLYDCHAHTHDRSR